MIQKVYGVGVHRPPLERDVDGLVINSKGEIKRSRKRKEAGENNEGKKDQSRRQSRVQQLVALFAALQALDSLAVHFLGHLLITFLLLLSGSTILNSLDMRLGDCQQD